MSGVLQLELHWRPRWRLRDGERQGAIEHYCLVSSEIKHKDAIECLLGHKVTLPGDQDALVAEVQQDARETLNLIAKEMDLVIEIDVVRDEGESMSPETGGCDDLHGELHEDGLDISFGGGCPIQGEGTLDGRPCYYRSRGSGWSLDVWPVGAVFGSSGDLPEQEEEWRYEEDAYVWPEGGWISAAESIKNLRTALAAWRAHLKKERQ